MIYIIRQNTSDVMFAFDAELDEKRTDAFKPTEHPIEDPAEVADYVVRLPKTFSASGILTATPIGENEDVSITRVMDLHDAITTVADNREVVTVVFGWWVFDSIIKNIEASCGQDTGLALKVSIEFQTIELAKVETTTIAPSKLKPKPKRRVKAVGGGGKKEADGKTEKKVRESILSKGKNVLAGMFRR